MIVKDYTLELNQDIDGIFKLNVPSKKLSAPKSGLSGLFINESTYLPQVIAASQKWGVPEPLIFAHMAQESAFDPLAYRAEPTRGDASYGLLQLLLETAKLLDPNATPDLLYTPDYNIDLGTQLMAKNLARYGGDIESEAASYNAGTAFKNANGQFTNSQGSTNVQNYVNSVMNYYKYYQSWLGNGAQVIDLTTWDITHINPYLVGGFAVMALITMSMSAKKTRREYAYS